MGIRVVRVMRHYIKSKTEDIQMERTAVPVIILRVKVTCRQHSVWDLQTN